MQALIRRLVLTANSATESSAATATWNSSIRTASARSATAVCALLTVVANAVIARDLPAEESFEEIVVTGSRIVRRDFSSPSPIMTLDRESLLTSGQPTLEAALNQTPQVTPDLDRTANNPGDGTARINLRGLGSQRTLVLLNGRRLAPSGVVNVITRRDVQGFGVDTSLYATKAGDSEIVDVNGYAGREILGGRGNVTFIGGYLDRSASFAGDRAFTSVPWIDVDGVLVPGGSTATPAGVVVGPPADLGNGPVQATFTPQGLPIAFNDPEDRYNYAPVNYLQTPLRRV